jgi:hypothetical protein
MRVAAAGFSSPSFASISGMRDFHNPMVKFRVILCHLGLIFSIVAFLPRFS